MLQFNSLHIGIAEENLTKLIQHANIHADSDIITNLQHLGCNIIAGVNTQLRFVLSRSPLTFNLAFLLIYTVYIISLSGSKCRENTSREEGAHGKHLPAL